MNNIPQTCFEFETDKSSLQVAITIMWHLEANADYFREVAKCPLKLFGQSS